MAHEWGLSMSSIATTYLPNDVLLVGDAQPVIGTAMLGDNFGKIKSYKVKRDGDGQELMNGAGALRAHVTLKPGFTATLEVYFDANVTAPAIYTLLGIVVDGATIMARVMAGAEITHDDGKERGLSMPVQMWDSLLGKAAYRLDTLTGIRYLLDVGIPVPTATPGSGTIVLDWPDVDDATSYEVQVSSDAGVTWAHLTTPTLSTYTHTVTTGQTRHYRIAAKTADGQGEWSATVNATAA